MAALIIRLPDGKRERLKDLARARKQSVTKLFDEMATVLLAEYDAETRFHVRAARGAGKAGRGLQLLAKAGGERKMRHLDEAVLTDYLKRSTKRRRTVLTRVRIGRAGAVREKLAALGIAEGDVRAAVKSARRRRR